MLEARESGFPLLRFCAFARDLFIWRNEVDRADAERAREMKQGHDRWISATALKVADILLRESGRLCELLLCEALLPSQSPEIPADQLAHVHVRKMRLYTL